jgi:hypothetical protein
MFAECEPRESAAAAGSALPPRDPGYLALAEYFRCPAGAVRVRTAAERPEAQGYFTFDSLVCYGTVSGIVPSSHIGDRLPDATHALNGHSHRTLPFDLAEVASNLREEQYRQNGRGYVERLTGGNAARYIYYLLRPSLPVHVRRHLQKIRLNGWESIFFPRWPVDVTVDALMRRALAFALQADGAAAVPFVWFWPDGAHSCVVMTHDVEGPAGRAFCDQLMDIDDEYGIKSSFQLVPEGHESTWQTLASRMRARGFEVNLHDLNHDGYLFHERDQFLERAGRINAYAREFGCGGFRAGAMYRQQRWYDAFEFSYDMSVPNVAHLEPQRGGCCTVMPYFVGGILELPLTTVQDYSLFHILEDYSTTLWKQQTAEILRNHGLVTYLMHPDYLSQPRARAVYLELLSYVRQLRTELPLWMALPGDVNEWWRNRSRMTLVEDGQAWKVVGPGSERARVGYATLADGKVQFSVVPPPDGTANAPAPALA